MSSPSEEPATDRVLDPAWQASFAAWQRQLTSVDEGKGPSDFLFSSTAPAHEPGLASDTPEVEKQRMPDADEIMRWEIRSRAIKLDENTPWAAVLREREEGLPPPRRSSTICSSSSISSFATGESDESLGLFPSRGFEEETIPMAVHAEPDASHKDGHRIYRKLRTLSEIRLLSVLPGNPDEAVRCTMERTRIEEAGDYATLSYMWEDPPQKGCIVLFDRKREVSRSVEDSLRRIRSSSQPRRIWIDALCINQSDNEERAQQVNLMRSIYERATECIVWLGEFDDSGSASRQSRESQAIQWQGDEQDEMLVETCLGGHIHEHVDKASCEAALTMPFPDAEAEPDSLGGAFCILFWATKGMHLSSMPLFKQPTERHPFVARCLKALAWLFSRPYWTRMWIVQEVVVSHRVLAYAGRYVMPFAMMGDAISILARHLSGCCRDWTASLSETFIRALPDLDVLAFYFLPLRQIRKDWHDPDAASFLTLPRLVMSTCSRRSTDPRDKVYSLLGLIRDWKGQPPLEPDYTKSQREVFRDFGLWLLRQDLGYLIFAPSRTAAPPSSSWQPDLSVVSSIDHARLQFAHPLMKRFHASLDWKYALKATRAGPVDCLQLESIKIGAIHVSSRLADSWPFPDASELNPTGEKTYITGEPHERAFWKTIYMDTATPTGPAGKVRQLSGAELERIVSDCSFYRSLTDDRVTPGPLRLPIWSRDSQASGEIELKTLFRTNTGYLGHTLSSFSAGDEVILPLGSSLPFIIRASGVRIVEGYGETLVYRLVGWCYVHGIMEGELVQELRQANNTPSPIFLI